MIKANHLVKWYGPTLAVEDVSFEIPAGQIVGFLGPNGAGKSTTLRILTGYLPPTSGSASIDGHDVMRRSEQARATIGYLPEGTPLYGEMRVTEYLDYRGRLFGMDRTKRKHRMEIVIDRCGLAQVRSRIIGQLSRGNRQRVGLAQALLGEPPVLILDEPTAGLDPNQIGQVRQLIGELRGKHTILVSTHILPEVEKTADRVMIIAGGQLVAEGTPDELRQQVRSGSRVLVEAKASRDVVHEAIKQINTVHKVEIQLKNGWSQAIVTPKGKADVREEIGKALLSREVPIREMRYEAASLEAFFVQITDTRRSQSTTQESQESQES